MQIKANTPRQWATDIAALKTLEERQAALKTVPGTLLPIVKSHLKDTWWRRNFTKDN